MVLVYLDAHLVQPQDCLDKAAAPLLIEHILVLAEYHFVHRGSFFGKGCELILDIIRL